MIFVSVGTRPEPFTRLVNAMDRVAAQLNEPVVMQTGHTPLAVHYAQAQPWLNADDYRGLLEQARVVISQAGAGSILGARQAGRPLIVVARSRQFNECPDDHQCELAHAVEQLGYAQFVRDITPTALIAALTHVIDPGVGELTQSPLVATVRSYLAHWDRALSRRKGF
jgi:UDP-N-acetylglucosamine transferase subunit ALG13